MEHVLKIKGTKKKWYNKYCQQVVERRRIAQKKFINVNSVDTRVLYLRKEKFANESFREKKGNTLMTY